VEVEIWSDIICPWCYIGKRHFEAALGQFEHADQVRVTWRSFELDPNAPLSQEGDRAERLAAKYNVTVEHAREMEAHVTAVAAGDGLEYRLDIAQSANSFDAHRLIHLAAEFGLQDSMKERLMRAYFTEGRLISDHETLAALADELAIPAEATIELLRTDKYTDAVRAAFPVCRPSSSTARSQSPGLSRPRRSCNCSTRAGSAPRSNSVYARNERRTQFRIRRAYPLEA
jgi:predicted DsbA family dithiol-disulfide isomerase